MKGLTQIVTQAVPLMTFPSLSRTRFWGTAAQRRLFVESHTSIDFQSRTWEKTTQQTLVGMCCLI